jgi:hypothetical protein
MVLRINNTLVSDTPFSGKVGSAGCVDFPVLRKVSQDAMRFIVDVVVCRLTANHHHLKMLSWVSTRPQRFNILPI